MALSANVASLTRSLDVEVTRTRYGNGRRINRPRILKTALVVENAVNRRTLSCSQRACHGHSETESAVFGDRRTQGCHRARAARVIVHIWRMRGERNRSTIAFGDRGHAHRRQWRPRSERHRVRQRGQTRHKNARPFRIGTAGFSQETGCTHEGDRGLARLLAKAGSRTIRDHGLARAEERHLASRALKAQCRFSGLTKGSRSEMPSLPLHI
jgi:hypothetical protein